METVSNISINLSYFLDYSEQNIASELLWVIINYDMFWWCDMFMYEVIITGVVVIYIHS